MITCKIPPRLKAAFSDAEFSVAYAVADDAVEIWLHGIIGDEYTQTDSASIGQILAANRGKPVTLRVNSPGGLAYDGVAMFNAIDQHDGPTTGIIDGKAGSAASLAVIACDTVKCHAGGVFQPHYSLIMAMGHQADIREALAIQERLDEDFEQLYAAASGRTIAQVKDDLLGPNGDGVTFSAEQAMAAGYVDEVIPMRKNKQAASVQPRENEVGHRQAAAIIRKQLDILRASALH